MGQAFMFTDAGVVPIGTDPQVQAQRNVDGLDFAPAVVRQYVPPQGAPRTEPVTQGPPYRGAPGQTALPFKTENVGKLMRARLREVEREIKKLKSLELERDELKRMLAAANKKPTTNVSALKRAI